VSRSLTAFEGHGGFPGWYLVTGFVAAFPWFALLGPALRARLGQARADPETRFLVAWLLGPLILFELVRTKLAHYWLPAYPAGVLLVTAWLFRPGARALLSTGPRSAAAWLTVSAGLFVAAAPAGAARYFGIADLTRPGLIAALPLLLGLLVFARAMPGRPRLGTTALAVGAALQLTLVAAAWLPRLSDTVVERRAARVLASVWRAGDAVVAYGVRAADALVALPSGTAVCAVPACVDSLVEARGRVLGVGSAEGVADLDRRSPGLDVEWFAAESGLDLVHGRWERWIVFRAGRDGGRGS
jgi:4-amino-4-deoxy-L-arabinose transferase-like glycosyltransferase